MKCVFVTRPDVINQEQFHDLGRFADPKAGLPLRAESLQAVADGGRTEPGPHGGRRLPAGLQDSGDHSGAQSSGRLATGHVRHTVKGPRLYGQNGQPKVSQQIICTEQVHGLNGHGVNLTDI